MLDSRTAAPRFCARGTDALDCADGAGRRLQHLEVEAEPARRAEAEGSDGIGSPPAC